MKVPCRPVVRLPDRALGAAEAARLWAVDRRNLGECGRSKAALTEAVNAIEEQGRE
ncbi:hypothetical protein JYP46_14445 [Nitratireductor aquimarinus]|uniref:hypothetical protein n=1 Tax=Alphaproteobacteria TaxID=28211 RepID=UPI0019D3F444|nr:MULTISPECIES: hypothetical protein [Alphaproteobacteria]MBN7758021.1 hypothetical protein [Nitratireductor aquimarinus]MBY6000783.1 hypothetical protein [Tritonibacter mobilis]MBY6022814.1 hypothetical protein [Nitratireductor sp. DP7N14-4]MDV2968265.1 hypothetical protein [Nitratireductor aquimarinus]